MSKHTPGPWIVDSDALDSCFVRQDVVDAYSEINKPVASLFCGEGQDMQANARLISAAPDLLGEAHVLRCLATSPRFQNMSVARALAELQYNGCGHDNGAALAKVTGDVGDSRLAVLCKLHGQTGGTIHQFNERYKIDFLDLSEDEFSEWINKWSGATK